MTAILGYPIETQANDKYVSMKLNSEKVLYAFSQSIKSQELHSIKKVLPFYLSIVAILLKNTDAAIANDQLIPFSEHSDHLMDDQTDENFWYPSSMKRSTEQCPASSWTHFPVPSETHILTEEQIPHFSEEVLDSMSSSEKNVLISDLVKKLVRNDKLLRKCLNDFQTYKKSLLKFSISQLIVFGCYYYGRRYLTLKYQLSINDWETVKRNNKALKNLILKRKNLNRPLSNGKLAMVGSSVTVGTSLSRFELFLCLMTSLSPFQLFFTGVSANAMGSATAGLVGDMIAEDGTEGNLFTYIEKWVGGGVRYCYRGTAYAVTKIAPFTSKHIRQNFQSHRKWPYAMDNMFENKMLPIILHNLTYNQAALTGSEILNSVCQEFLSPRLDQTKIIKSTNDKAWKQFERDQSLSQAMSSLQEALVRPSVLGDTVLKALARANKIRRQDSKRYEKFINCLGHYLIRYADANDTNFEQFVCSVMLQIVEASKRGLLTKRTAREFIRMILKHVKHPDAKLIDVSILEATLDLCKNGFRI